MAKKDAGKSGGSGQTLTKKCPGHAKHMCELVRMRNMDEVARLAKDAQSICHICGRAAAKASNLCEGIPI